MNLAQTRRYAIKAHGCQKYGPFAYSHHLNAAIAVALRFGFRDVQVRKRIWLHDVPEDCGITAEQLLADGHELDIVIVVMAVTDEPGKNRKIRKLLTYPKIRAVGHDAILVKLCDRIANVEFAITQREGKLKMYQSEHAEFTRQLRDRTDLELEPMWNHLDSLLSPTGFARTDRSAS